MVLSYAVVYTNTSITLDGTSTDTVFVNPTDPTVNITLPPITANGTRYLIKRTDYGSNSVVVLPSGSDTVYDSSTLSLSGGTVTELVSNVNANTGLGPTPFNWEATSYQSL